METMSLRADDLTVFLRVVDRGGFSTAARDLHLTPGAVSKQVARLEGRLRVRLFERSTRSVRLTDEGQSAIAHARAALASLGALAEVGARSRGVLEGAVRVAAPAPFGRKYVAPAIADFRARHPRVDFELRLSDQIVDLLRSDLDVAIRIGDLADSTLVARRLAPNERLLVASPAYLAKRTGPGAPADLAAHTCLVFGYPGALQNVWSLRSGRKQARVTVEGGLRSDSGEVLREWCRSGLGISLRESWDVVDELRAGALVEVLPGWRAAPTSIFAVRAPRTPLPYRIAAFLDFVARRWRAPSWTA